MAAYIHMTNSIFREKEAQLHKTDYKLLDARNNKSQVIQVNRIDFLYYKHIHMLLCMLEVSSHEIRFLS